jgi:hypothetical protein
MCSSGRPLKEIAHDLGVATKMLRPGCCALHANIRHCDRHGGRGSSRAVLIPPEPAEEQAFGGE